MNLASKKIRKAMNRLEVGASTFFPWAIISAGGLDDRPHGPAVVGFRGKVYHMEPSDAGLKVTRYPDEMNDAVKIMAGWET